MGVPDPRRLVIAGGDDAVAGRAEARGEDLAAGRERPDRGELAARGGDEVAGGLVVVTEEERLLEMHEGPRGAPLERLLAALLQVETREPLDRARLPRRQRLVGFRGAAARDG